MNKNKAPFHHSLSQKLRDYFLAGIVVTAPIFLTLYLTWVFLLFVDARVTPLIPAPYNPNTYLPFSLPGLGLLVACVFFVLAGWFARNFMGRLLIRISEYIVQRVPVIRLLYRTMKQVFETIVSNPAQAFREVVMVEFPKEGSWSVGFVTGSVPGEMKALADDEVLSVFLPAALSPTTGFLVFVPRRNARKLEMSVEDALKLVISGGIIAPK